MTSTGKSKSLFWYLGVMGTLFFIVLNTAIFFSAFDEIFYIDTKHGSLMTPFVVLAVWLLIINLYILRVISDHDFRYSLIGLSIIDILAFILQAASLLLWYVIGISRAWP